jgi:hypothetical protein
MILHRHLRVFDALQTALSLLALTFRQCLPGGNMRFKIMVFAALFLAACGGPDSYIGKWQSDGETLQLLKDGKVLMETQSGPASGTWRPDEAGGIIVSLNVSGKTVVVRMHIESGKLVSEYNGVTGRLTRLE